MPNKKNIKVRETRNGVTSRALNVEQMPLIAPTRLGFEKGDLWRVTYDYTDGSQVIWQRDE